MAITIEKLSDTEILVNGKPVLRDMNDKWIARQQTTMQEAKCFNDFLQSLEACPKITQATYEL